MLLKKRRRASVGQAFQPDAPPRRGQAGKPDLRRRAFTLVELLVVIAIIAVLMTLTAAAVMRFTGVGLASATKTDLGKVNTKLNEQWKGVTDAAHKDTLSDTNDKQHNAYVQRAQMFGTSNADKAVRTKYVQLRQTQAFPTNFNEAFWPDAYWKPGSPSQSASYAWPGYVAYLNELGIRPDNESQWGAISLDVQASVCILMIVQKGPKAIEATGDNFGSAVGLVDLGSGFSQTRGVVDAWRRPVLLTRSSGGGGKSATLTVTSAGKDGKFNTGDDIVVAP